MDYRLNIECMQFSNRPHSCGTDRSDSVDIRPQTRILSQNEKKQTRLPVETICVQDQAIHNAVRAGLAGGHDHRADHHHGPVHHRHRFLDLGHRRLHPALHLGHGFRHLLHLRSQALLRQILLQKAPWILARR